MNQKMKKGMDILKDLNGKFFEEIKKKQYYYNFYYLNAIKQ